MKKHVLYKNLSRPVTLAGVPRKGLFIALFFASPWIVVFYLLFRNPLAGFIFGLFIFGLSYLVILIQATRDPDALEIAYTRSKLDATKRRVEYRGRRYAA
jgi:type IV secretory pathway VirB3-like protein